MKPTKVTLEQVMAAVERSGFIGFCIECGAETEPVEPDTEKERCDACGCLGVYGAEELLLRMEF